MKITFRFHISDFNYTAPITVQKHTVFTNQVLHVLIFQNEHLLTKLDLTSLPFFHQYTLHEWRYLLQSFFLENTIDLSEIKLDLPFFNMIKQPQSVIYQGELLNIIESVLFKIIEHSKPSAIDFIVVGPIKLNGLYNKILKMDNLPDCLKIKIRPDKKNLLQTCELINLLIQNKPSIKLRLDGNGCFELRDLNLYLAKLNAKESIEYIEDPFKNLSDIYDFNYPIAIDESLVAYKNQLPQLRNFAVGTTLILKPSVLGISKSFEILKFAEDSYYNVVISSSYETASAIRPLLYLATLSHKSYHGLDTLKFLPKEFSINCENYSINFRP